MVIAEREPTCKTCYWYSLCPERSRLYPCRIFEDTQRGGVTDGQAAPVGRSALQTGTAAPAERPAHAVRGLESGGDPPRDTDQSLYTGRTE